MKPHTVNQISIKSETPKEHLSKLEVDVVRQQVKAWKESGQPIPDAVMERAREMGIDVKA